MHIGTWFKASKEAEDKVNSKILLLHFPLVLVPLMSGIAAGGQDNVWE